MIRHLLTGDEFDHDAMMRLFDLTAKIKRERFSPNAIKPLAGKSIGVIFAKSSTRTRVSFEVGIHELGGHAVILDMGKTQMGRGETIHDTAKVLSRYLQGIVIRTYKQSDVEGLAEHGTASVINALTDDYHPCQALGDLFTILEKKGSLDGVKMAYLGDGASNMSNSLALVSKIAGIEFAIAAPEEFRPADSILNYANGSGKISWTKDPKEALDGADFIYTDVWVSMGFEEEAKERMRILQPYQLNGKQLALAKKDVSVMHCLPAHRGEEITDEVMDSPNSIVFDEAENRLHIQKAIMATLMPE